MLGPVQKKGATATFSFPSWLALLLAVSVVFPLDAGVTHQENLETITPLKSKK